MNPTYLMVYIGIGMIIAYTVWYGTCMSIDGMIIALGSWIGYCMYVYWYIYRKKVMTCW